MKATDYRVSSNGSSHIPEYVSSLVNEFGEATMAKWKSVSKFLASCNIDTSKLTRVKFQFL